MPRQRRYNTGEPIDFLNGFRWLFQSGAEATAVQTLRVGRTLSNLAKCLDCGAFTAAFIPACETAEI